MSDTFGDPSLRRFTPTSGGVVERQRRSRCHGFLATLIVPHSREIVMHTPTFDPTSPAEGATSAMGGSKDTLARGIDSAAAKLREKADTLPGGERVSSAAYRAADVMETAADYVGERDIREMLAEMGQLVKKHPGATLLTAAAAGFLLAHALSRR
jgi:ElaB/YqjD/DUF883 family membrane-anchored ribosome-binding protein